VSAQIKHIPAATLSVGDAKLLHTEADTIDKLDPHEMALCVATMAVVAYGVADMQGTLPRGAAGTR
jgi:hypothetical protein